MRWLGLYIFMALILWGLLGIFAHAGTLNPTSDPAISEWFQELRQPDNKRVPCCGEADAFEADEFFTDKDGDLMAVITDGQGILPNGTSVRIPEEKYPRGGTRNPTGHGIVFLHVVNRKDVQDEDTPWGPADIGKILVYCWIQPNGA